MGKCCFPSQINFPPKSKFNAEDIPDLTGKVIIITGANTGVLAKSYSQSNDDTDRLYSIFFFQIGIGKKKLQRRVFVNANKS
jgi:hypothetical protein